ncbi:beta strand repeat-containing protein [Dokdonella soli]|uniref:Calx-beta domain-containing protein n=1 Tax=Dokdonella soli TaxID=529810 RepID=A0ABP3TX16_9GAMM
MEIEFRMWRQLSTLALGLCASLSSLADTTAFTVAAATKGTSSSPVTMLFPVTRSGDIGYEAVLSYHTVNGTAAAGLDYDAATPGSVVVPAGSSANIPVTIAAYPSGGPDRTFQVVPDSATGIGPTPGFAAQQTFGAGARPLFVTGVDVNGDGKPDLIVANNFGNTVSVLLNTATPGAATSFATQQTFATGALPYSVAVADVNGDGKPDLIVANYGDNTVSVLLNTTAPGAVMPSFATQQTFATGAHPFSITATDVNGDGKPDLIVANSGGNSVSVLLNTTAPGAATASFATQQAFAAGLHPFSVTATDVNGDGKADLIVANYGSNSVSVLLNTTASGAVTPSFAIQQTFATGAAPYSVTATDVNGDGKPDLIVANNNGNTVSVLLNTTASSATTPSFGAQQTFAAGSGPISVTATDVNGDGKPDLIVANYGGNSVSVLLNKTAPGAPTARFAIQQAFAAGAGAVSVNATDVNGDGKPDLIVANGNDNTVSVLLNTTAPGATPNFATQQTFTAGTHPNSVTATDVNGDGKPDLIVANGNDNTVSVLLNTTAPGAATPSFATQQTFATGVAPHSVTAADVNGDGKPDLIVANTDDNTVSVLLNTTAPGSAMPSFATQRTFVTGGGPESVIAADVNGDGRPDLIVANYSGAVSVLLNTTAPGAASSSFATQQTFASGSSSNSVAAADVNGDGKPDLVVANRLDHAVSVLLNTTASGATTPSFATQQTFATGSIPASVTAADINGDGKPDLIAANFGGNSVSVLLNTTAPGAATASFATQQTFVTGLAPFSVTVADVNGDGKPDLIVANDNDNTVSVLLNTTAPGAATPTFATQQTFATGASPNSIVVADVNGDGKPDLIAANYADTTVSVLLNAQYLGIPSASPATGTIVHDYIFANGFE